MKSILRNAPWLIFAALILFAGKAWGAGSASSVTVTQIDTVEVDEYRAVAESYRIESEGLRARLEDVESRPPRTIVRVDTLVAPPDTVLTFVTVRDGSLTYERLTGRDSLYAPEIAADVDVSDCDEGWAIQGGEVVCDRARFGHLRVSLEATLTEARAGFSWIPSYRSPWVAFGRRAFSYDRNKGDRWDIGVGHNLEVF